MEQEFWEGVYQSGQTRFDLAGPTIPLCDFLDRARLQPKRALIPGCGRGHDVIELARRGWEALGVDFAPSAIHDATMAASEAKQPRATFLQADLFALETAPVDLWWENTCYCAIDPSRRDEYASVAASLIAPGGVLLFLVFPTFRSPPLVAGEAPGPPFVVEPSEVEPRFQKWFVLESLDTPERSSRPDRQDRELLAVLRRKAD